MGLKYKCIILDHDDTTVDSTARIHHPAFLQSMSVLRPGVSMTLEEYFEMNCDPGIVGFYRDVVKLTPEETAWEHDQWLNYAAAHTPSVYPEMRRLMEEEKEGGGYICVVSHNLEENIRRDYERNHLPMPDLIFGGDYPKEKQKPFAWPVEQIRGELKLAPEEVLMVDDLIPGFMMAREAGIDFAAACWAHQVAQVRAFFKEENADCFYAPSELYRFLFVQA